MANIVSGINEPNLKKLILEIYDYRDKISKLLSTAENLVYETKTYYDSVDGDELRRKFALLHSNFTTLLSNIKDYGNDLELILRQYKQNQVKNVDTIKK